MFHKPFLANFSIYASPCLTERKLLWSNIEEVGQLHSLPWLMVGDFNEVLCAEDKFGGNQININRTMAFKACLDSSNFVDLGFAGPKFTWSNKRQITDLILERIGRCLANPLWRILYPEAAVTHLPRTFSDHHPVLIELSRLNFNTLNKPFRFQSMWLMHLDFPRIVKEAWLENNPLQVTISNFAVKAKKWNREVFGNMFAKKRRVLARLNRAQKALADRPSDFLVCLEKQLLDEYALVLLQEEEYWALKPRLNATTFGD